MGLIKLWRRKPAKHEDADNEERDLKRYQHGGKTIDFTECEAVERDPVQDSGEWMFKGTGINLKQVLWYLAENHNLDEAVHEFYGEVDREAMAEVLRYMGDQLSIKGL